MAVDADGNVPTARGPARVVESRPAGPPRGTVVLGHGAGGGSGARDLAALADALPGRGWSVLRVDQPWVVAGRRVADRPELLDAAWLDVLAHLAATGRLGGPLVLGGRSAGARVACRTATSPRLPPVAGVVALAFPLHPPWRPERSRRAELEGAGVPVLVVQGERDGFGSPEDFGPGPYDLVAVPGADHSFAAARGAPLPLPRVVDAVAGWLLRLGT